MEKDKISIIIPIYNVEEFIGYCIKSVLDQDYKNIELILVDDGSTDSTGTICDDYAKLDSRIVVIHKEYGGVSSARTAGLKVMTGDYFAFIDSDDFVRRDYITLMYKYIIDDCSDMVVCSFKKVVSDIDYTQIPEEEFEHNIYDCETACYKMISRQVPMYVVCKLYKASLLEWLYFPEGRIYEDVAASWGVVKHANQITYITNQLYFYRQRSGSIVNATYKHARMDQIYFAEEIFNEVEDGTKLKYAAASRCFFASADNYTLVTEEFPEDIAYLKKCLKKYRGYVLKDSGETLKLKLMALISYINVGLVRIVGKLYKKNNFRNFKKVK